MGNGLRDRKGNPAPERELIRREAEAFQPEPTPPLAVRYLLGWASQPYGLAQQ